MKTDKIQLRAVGTVESSESRSISGYAIRFNEWSSKLYDIWSNKYFREMISPEAITPEFLAEQDIRVLYDHNANGLSLARWNKGQGTLELTIDEQGLFFRFDAPATSFGDEILNAIQRKDIDKVSFAFYADPEDIAEVQGEDGIYERTVNKFLAVTEISLLDVAPAYPETSVDNRNSDNINMDEKIIEELQNKIDELEKKLEAVVQEEADDEEENPMEEEKPTSEQEEPVEDAPEEAPEDNEEDNETREDEEENPEENNEKEENKERSINTMNKKNFSLLKAIRSVVNNNKLDEISQAVSDLGAQELRAAGLPCTGQIHLPVEHRDAPVTVNSYGEDVVVTEFTDILEPLRANNVLADAGARIMTGLVGDLQVPTMDAQQVGWAGEIAAAAESGAAFDHVLLQPKRLTAYIDVSKQFLVQDSLGAEELIKRDLINAIQDKLEATILGTAAGDTTKPAGIFYNVSPTTVADFGDVCDLEADIEDANFNGGLAYILSPKAKAALRSMVIGGTGPAGMVYVNNEVDGTPAYTTTNMATKTFAVGDWSNLVVGQWGAIDLVVDPFSQAANGVVRIVINAFFDAKMVREGAIAYGAFA